MTFIMSYTLSYFDVPMEGGLAMSDTWELDDDELPPERERLQILSPEEYELFWRMPRFSAADRDLFFDLSPREEALLAHLRTPLWMSDSSGSSCAGRFRENSISRQAAIRQLQPFDLMNANVQLSQVVIELPFATSQGYCINQGRIALETTGKMR